MSLLNDVTELPVVEAGGASYALACPHGGVCEEISVRIRHATRGMGRKRLVVLERENASVLHFSFGASRSSCVS